MTAMHTFNTLTLHTLNTLTLHTLNTLAAYRKEDSVLSKVRYPTGSGRVSCYCARVSTLRSPPQIMTVPALWRNWEAMIPASVCLLK